MWESTNLNLFYLNVYEPQFVYWKATYPNLLYLNLQTLICFIWEPSNLIFLLPENLRILICFDWVSKGRNYWNDNDGGYRITRTDTWTSANPTSTNPTRTDPGPEETRWRLNASAIPRPWETSRRHQECDEREGPGTYKADGLHNLKSLHIQEIASVLKCARGNLFSRTNWHRSVCSKNPSEWKWTRNARGLSSKYRVIEKDGRDLKPL